MADRENIKESIPLYESGTRKEMLLTIRDFVAFIDTYELWTNATANSIYGKFRRCFKGDVRSACNKIINGEPRTEADFEDQVVNLVVGEFGIDVLKYQIKYLRKTTKPENMTVYRWFKRIQFINRTFPFLSGVGGSDGNIRKSRKLKPCK